MDEVKETVEETVEENKEAEIVGKKAVMQFTVTAFDDSTIGIGLPDGEVNLWVVRGILATALTQVSNILITKAV